MNRRAVVVALVALAPVVAVARPAPPPPPVVAVAQPAPPQTPPSAPPQTPLASPQAVVASSDAPGVRGVSFAEAVQLALAHNSDARVALDEVARAEGLLAEATATLRPLVGVQGQYQQLEADREVSGRETTAAESVLGEVTLSMPILSFRARADRQRARDQVEVERASAMTTQRAVAITAGRAYLEVFATRRLIEVAVLARDTAKAHVDYARTRRAGGLGTDLDIVRAEAEFATDEANVANAQTALVQAEEALGVLAGQVGPLGSTAEPDLRDADDAQIEQRADLAGGRERLSAAQSSRDAQWAEWVPTLSLQGNAFFDAPQIDPTPRFGFQLLAVLAMPLYDGGYRGGLRRERDAVLAEAHEELDQLQRTASSEVRAARESVRRAREARDAAHRSADLAARALDLANVAYSGGTGTSLEVIDAQRSARDAATQAVIADDSLRQAQFALLAAAGHFP
ncbi:MAG TPA: TolC family protein [Kofleriaceae bacterium]